MRGNKGDKNIGLQNHSFYTFDERYGFTENERFHRPRWDLIQHNSGWKMMMTRITTLALVPRCIFSLSFVSVFWFFFYGKINKAETFLSHRPLIGPRNRSTWVKDKKRKYGSSECCSTVRRAQYTASLQKLSQTAPPA